VAGLILQIIRAKWGVPPPPENSNEPSAYNLDQLTNCQQFSF
jgi:hypothetical protein